MMTKKGTYRENNDEDCTIYLIEVDPKDVKLVLERIKKRQKKDYRTD